MELGAAHIIGILFVLLLIAGVGIYSGRRVSNAADFTNGGGKAGTWLVAGTIMGTLVSGQATVGTAQLAFSFGMSAWWFTLGSGLGCLFLALGYVTPMRRTGCTTLVGVISTEYGKQCGCIASVLSSIGIFVSVIAQMISATALLTAALPISLPTAAVISAIIMAIYVIFGGVWGAGIGGIVKLIFLYVSVIVSGIIVLHVSGGISGLGEILNQSLIHTELGRLNNIFEQVDLDERFYLLLARGPLSDLGSGLSLILGVLSTQTYASAIWSAKTDQSAKRGALLSALLIPPIGIMCILIGLFMRGHCITAAEANALFATGKSLAENTIIIDSTAQVFPAFVIYYLPKLFGGVVLGTLLITIVGGGAGLSLGVSTILVNDLFGHTLLKTENIKNNLLLTRLGIVNVLVISAAIAVVVPSAVINDFGYLSMGLRGAVAFAPLCTALFLPHRIPHKFALSAIVVGPALVLVGNMVLPAEIDPLFIGVAASFLILIIGFICGNRSHSVKIR